MPAATLAVAQEVQISFATTGSLVMATGPIDAESPLLALEGKTALQEEVALEQETFGPASIIGAAVTASRLWGRTSFNISETTRTPLPTPRFRENIASGVRPYLTGNMLRLYRVLRAIVLTKANVANIAIEDIHTYMFRDPEENTNKFVLAVAVKANAPQAMAYWDALGRGVDTWRNGLPEHLREVLVSRWSFRVHWG